MRAPVLARDLAPVEHHDRGQCTCRRRGTARGTTESGASLGENSRDPCAELGWVAFIAAAIETAPAACGALLNLKSESNEVKGRSENEEAGRELGVSSTLSIGKLVANSP